MITLNKLCVFCGSNTGTSKKYEEAAIDLAKVMLERKIGLVYGGAGVGLMGILADTILQGGGEVIGIIPKALSDKEIAHRNLTKLHVVATMHERKQKMSELSDGFMAIPGGLGTLEEILEILTWSQLGLNKKPAGFLNVEGIFDPLFKQLDTLVTAGFLLQRHRDMILSDSDPQKLLERFQVYQAPDFTKWISGKET